MLCYCFSSMQIICSITSGTLISEEGNGIYEVGFEAKLHKLDIVNPA